MSSTEDLKVKASAMPDAAGVYLMKDASGQVIYVGKANSLKKRLGSYFGRDLATKTVALMSHVAIIEYELCPTESLALLREANLIRKYMPKYNISLRDDKSFPYVVITNEEYPAIYVTRKKENDGAVYIGPYTSANLLREALRIIRQEFSLSFLQKTSQEGVYLLPAQFIPCSMHRKDLQKRLRLFG